MAVLATLASTTFTAQVSASSGTIQVASVSGLAPGTRLFSGREMMSVIRVREAVLEVDVRRGMDGTAATAHTSNDVVYIGRADQFFASDPVGVPLTETLVSPYINVLTGAIWTAQGDEEGPGAAARFWQQSVVTPGVGALGVRQTTSTP